MPVWLSLGSWVVLRALRSPVVWVFALLSAGLCPLFARLAPLGQTVHGLPAGTTALEWSRPIAWLAAGAGIAWLSSAQSLLERAAWITRGAAEWAALVLLVALAWVPLWLGALVGGLELGLAANEIGARLLGELALVVAFAALSLRLHVPMFGRVLAFLLLVWAVPALVAPHAPGALAALVVAPRAGPAEALVTLLAAAAWLALDLALLAPRRAR